MTEGKAQQRVLCGVFAAVMGCHVPKQLGEERVYFAYCSISQFVINGNTGRNSSNAETWRQELMQGLGGVLLTGLLFVACSPFL